MGGKKTPKQIAGFIAYVLGRGPGEFGLVPDAEGFVKVKSLLQALGEEPGWGFIRRSHIEEILIVFPEAGIEIRENRIRAVDRRHLPGISPAQYIPRQLFTCVRRKGYAHALEKGLRAAGPDAIILSDSEEMALRMGKRMDPEPVLLKVSVREAQDQGAVFFNAGESLYRSDQIPPGCFSGPALPKERAALPQKPERTPGKRGSAGSFLLNLGPKSHAPAAKGKPKGGTGPSWKRDRKRLRKEKEKLRLKGDPAFVFRDVGGED